MEEAYVIGAVVVAFVAALGEWFHRYRVKELKKAILRGVLTDPAWQWRTIEVLQRVIRENAETTKELLIEIGARASVGEKEVWKLDK